MNLTVETTVEEGRAVIAVIGEVDVSNAATLRDAIDAVLADPATKSLRISLAAVPYIDSTGIGVLVGAAHKSEDAGIPLAVFDAQNNAARIMGMLGVNQVIDLQSSEK